MVRSCEEVNGAGYETHVPLLHLNCALNSKKKKSYATGREATFFSNHWAHSRVNIVTWLRRWWRRKQLEKSFFKKDPVKNLVNDFVREIKSRVCFVKQNYQFRYPDSLAFHLLSRYMMKENFRLARLSRTKAKTLRFFLSLHIKDGWKITFNLWAVPSSSSFYLLTRLEFLMWNSIRLWINLFLSYVAFFSINRAYIAIYLQIHAVL